MQRKRGKRYKDWSEPSLKLFRAEVQENGKRGVDPSQIPWEEWKARAERAARRGRAGRPDAVKPRQMTYQAPEPERRCDFVMTGDRGRCPHWAMRGATRCRHHGGLRQNPEHPAVRRHLAKGTIQGVLDARSAATKLRAEAEPGEVKTVREALRAAGWNGAPAKVVLDGVRALRAEDGRAWRRFLADSRDMMDKSIAGREHAKATPQRTTTPGAAGRRSQK